MKMFSREELQKNPGLMGGGRGSDDPDAEDEEEDEDEDEGETDAKTSQVFTIYRLHRTLSMPSWFLISREGAQAQKLYYKTRLNIDVGHCGCSRLLPYICVYMCYLVVSCSKA